MDLSAISPAAVVADRMAATRDEVAVAVLRKTLDMTASQGQALARMIDQQAGLGRSLDTYA
ncbi:MAG: hypothetical protein BWY56_01782 [Acidobacteria bacterium ADurb.Bin340]|nr:MAG: hypothetical protein BWY56_01782 [Acidobacteria bacterium ADurb.Bin340]HOD34170.1 YjfB family protein [Holophaga sp.]